MADIEIDRLTITAPGWTTASAERLARLIAERLSGAANHVVQQGRRDAMTVNLQAANGISEDQLASQIVDDLVRQLNRSL